MRPITIEPLSRHHQCSDFDCGIDRVNNFIRRTALKHMGQDLAVVRVAVLPNTPKVIGYYSLSSHSLQADDIPPDFRPKGRPFPGIGAFYLGFLGVDRSAQGRKLGHLLLADAMRHTAQASTHGGIAFLVLDAIDAARAKFYDRFGFVELTDPPLRMIIPTKTIRGAISPP